MDAVRLIKNTLGDSYISIQEWLSEQPISENISTWISISWNEAVLVNELMKPLSSGNFPAVLLRNYQQAISLAMVTREFIL